MALRASVFCKGSPVAILIPLTTPDFQLRITAFWKESFSLHIKLSHPWCHSPSAFLLTSNNDDRVNGRELTNGNSENGEETPV